MSKLNKLTTLLSTTPIKAYTAAQLRHVAKLVGANSSTGTKAELVTGILSVVRQVKENDDKTSVKSNRVLSIDMGVANLAYCTFEHSLLPVGSPLPVIREWNRVSLVHDAESNAKPTMQFSAPNLAQTAVKLVNDLVLSKPKELQPCHVLIERQRWRTMGGPRVLEWTIRVNTLEAMLWAILSSVQTQGIWKGQVHAIDPGRISGWWLETGVKNDTKASKKYAALKLAKVDLVRTWLKEGSHVVSGSPDCEKVLQALDLNAADRRKGSRAKKIENEHIGKLDDLADCMLQGVTFLKWLENRKRIVQKGQEGVEELLETKEQSKTTYG